MKSRTASYLRLAAVLVGVGWLVAAAVGCSGFKPLMVVTDHTPALVAPHAIAKQQNAAAQTSIGAAATQAVVVTTGTKRLRDLLVKSDAAVVSLVNATDDAAQSVAGHLRDAATQLAASESARAQAEAAAVAFAQQDVKHQTDSAASATRIKHLEDDYWSVRQHRQATAIKIGLAIFAVLGVIVCGFLATHPAANMLTHVVLSFITGGVYLIVLGVIHGVKWLTAHWHSTPAPAAPKAATV